MKKIFVILFLSLSLVACSTTQRYVKDHEQIVESYNKVIVFPSEVIINSQGIGGKLERKHNYESYLEDLVADESIIALEKAGLSAKFASKRHMHENKIAKFLPSLRDEYDEVKKSLYGAGLDVSKEKAIISGVTLPKIRNFSELLQADAYVMIDYEGVIQTTGSQMMQMAMTLFVPGGSSQSKPDESYTMVVSLVDARSGDVVWANASKAERGSWLGFNKEKAERNQLKNLFYTILYPVKDIKNPKKKKK